jgi:hypothetical protein
MRAAPNAFSSRSTMIQSVRETAMLMSVGTYMVVVMTGLALLLAHAGGV